MVFLFLAQYVFLRLSAFGWCLDHNRGGEALIYFSPKTIKEPYVLTITEIDTNDNQYSQMIEAFENPFDAMEYVHTLYQSRNIDIGDISYLLYEGREMISFDHGYIILSIRVINFIYESKDMKRLKKLMLTSKEK